MFTYCGVPLSYRGGIAQLVECPNENPRRSTIAGSRPRYDKGFFFPTESTSSALNFQLLRCPAYSPRVLWHTASTSVRTLKPRTLAAVPLSGHTKILHTLIEMGSAALATAVP